MEQIPNDDTWKPRRYVRAASGDQWGTARRADKVPETALAPEAGAWVAPPV